MLARTAAPTFLPLVLFEDPDVLETRMARLPRVHLMNTAAWLRALHDEGLLPEGPELMARIDAARASPMLPIDPPGQTSRVRSVWLRGRARDAR